MTRDEEVEAKARAFNTRLNGHLHDMLASMPKPKTKEDNTLSWLGIEGDPECVTITFERMPGVDNVPIKLRFIRHYYKEYDREITHCMSDGIDSFATLKLGEKFDWEIGMRVSLHYGTMDNRPVYRAFRRWMWLQKAVYRCDGKCFPWGEQNCENVMACLTNRAKPSDIIAREFGQVTVEVKC